MDNQQLTVHLGETAAECFLQKGFFCSSDEIPPIHKHKYTEIHLIAGGRATFHFAEQTLEVAPGEVVAIPAESFHRLTICKEPMERYAFQINLPLQDVKKCKISLEVLQQLIDAATALYTTAYSPKLAGYISYILNELFATNGSITPIQSREFIIHEFFIHHYNRDVHLSDIAAELHVSEKQAHRLILKYTGNTFSANLTKHRIEAAKLLAEADRSLSLSQIAQLVGYQSYGGFWKAYRRFCK